jgi:hypothetical protein
VKAGKKRKTAASATSVVPKGKKIKVLTHRLRYIETATMLNFDEGASSTIKTEQATPTARSAEELAAIPKVSEAESAGVPIQTAKAEEKTAEKLDREEKTGSPEAELSKVAKTPAITPKRRRMASVLDVVMETTRSLTPTPVKIAAEAVAARAETKAGPSAPMEAEPAATEQGAGEEFPDASVALEKNVVEEAKSPAPKAPFEDLDYIIRHALGKRLSEEEILEAKHYARELKYPKGALVLNGMDEDNFLYCLPDNKEIRLPGDSQKYGISEAQSWPLRHVKG